MRRSHGMIWCGRARISHSARFNVHTKNGFCTVRQWWLAVQFNSLARYQRIIWSKTSIPSLGWPKILPVHTCTQCCRARALYTISFCYILYVSRHFYHNRSQIFVCELTTSAEHSSSHNKVAHWVRLNRTERKTDECECILFFVFFVLCVGSVCVCVWVKSLFRYSAYDLMPFTIAPFYAVCYLCSFWQPNTLSLFIHLNNTIQPKPDIRVKTSTA